LGHLSRIGSKVVEADHPLLHSRAAVMSLPLPAAT
jgi:hypothetical protein